MTLARWQCHKIVAAGKIHGFTDGQPDVEQADGTKATTPVPASYFSRGKPSAGDYHVEYDDGYQSWSPAHAFETGYRRME